MATGTQILIKNAAFESFAVGYVPPVVDNLEGWFFINETLAKAARNWAGEDKSDGVFGGAPATSNRFFSFDPVNRGDYLATAIDETAEMTVLGVIRSTDSLDGTLTKPFFITNNNTGFSAGTPSRKSPGFSLYAASTTALSMQAARWTGSATAVETIGITHNFSNWSFVCARVSNAQKSVWSLSSSQRADAASSNPRDPALAKMRIGAALNTLNNGKSDIAFASIYSRFLTDAEVQAVYARVQAYLAPRTISI